MCYCKIAARGFGAHNTGVLGRGPSQALTSTIAHPPTPCVSWLANLCRAIRYSVLGLLLPQSSCASSDPQYLTGPITF
jgi:hypothetical protein